MKFQTRKATDAVKRSNNLKTLLVSLIESVQKLKSGTQGEIFEIFMFDVISCFFYQYLFVLVFVGCFND